jgi:hypothetical protein
MRKTLSGGVMSSVKKWSYEMFDDVTKELKNIQKKMEELSIQNMPGAQDELNNLRRCIDELDELNNLRRCIDELLYREEIMWMQHEVFTSESSGKAKKE